MSVTAAAGFEAAGVACGIKDSGALDLALVATADGGPVSAAGVFTTNLAKAAPVQVSREHLADGRAAAVVLNSGNANAATGEPGRVHARRTCELVASELGGASDHVLVCSTGLIGLPLPMDSIEAGVPKLAAELRADAGGGSAAADAILTTDTVRKEALATIGTGRAAVTVGGMAKGVAMLSPAMATMLAVLTTDALVTTETLEGCLEDAVDTTFNQLIVDGCTSTNDTVVVLASGAAGSVEKSELSAAMRQVCASLAEQMAGDAEGATKRVRVVVRGARSTVDARTAARAVASSQLVQCSLNGSDPYWGRVLSELGASGAVIEPERVRISYGDVVTCRDGVAAPHDKAALTQVMSERDIEICCELGLGSGDAAVLTTDLSHAYIDENRRTS